MLLLITSQSEYTSCYISRCSIPLSHTYIDTHEENVSHFRCRFCLGNGRYVEVKEWKGELRVDLREWENDRPTKKGISLTLMHWKNLVDQIEYVDEALREKKSYGSHLGGNVYCNIADKSVCVDIRQYWKPQEEVVPTRKGLCLRPDEYKRLKELLPEIGNTLPELNALVPCFLQSDHANQVGALQCKECNPNDFNNW